MLRRPINAAACLHRSALDLLPCTSSIKNAMSSGTPLGSEEHALSSADKAASVPGGPKSLRLRAGEVKRAGGEWKTLEHARDAVGTCHTQRVASGVKERWAIYAYPCSLFAGALVSGNMGSAK